MSKPITTIDPASVRGIHILVACEYCHEKGTLPGGEYQAQGEVIDCPVCHGTMMRQTTITLSRLYDLMVRCVP